MCIVESLKVVQNAGILYIFTCKCAWRHSGVQSFHIAILKNGPSMQCFVHFDFKRVSRYSGVQFFHIATSKSGPSMRCFVDFDFKMHFSLQRRAIFPHRNFKKWSEPAVFRTFWLQNVLFATAACNFSISHFQKAQRRAIFPHRNFKKWSEHAVFCTFWLQNVLLAIAARNFFHFSAQQPPPHPPLYRGYFSTQPNHKSLKNTAFRDVPNISCLWIFFLLIFAQLYLLSSDSTSLLCFFIFWLCYSALLFQKSILSEIRFLNFLRLIVFYKYFINIF